MKSIRQYTGGLYACAAATALCACSGPASTGIPPTFTPPAATAAAVPPVEQTIVFNLDKSVAGGGFFERLPATRNGSAATLSVSFSKYSGATLTVRYGPATPAGVPPIPGAKQGLVWVALKVDKTVVADGNWNVVLRSGSCAPNHTRGGYYPARNGWSTSSQYECKDFVVLPQWTLLRPGTSYVAAMYEE